MVTGMGALSLVVTALCNIYYGRGLVSDQAGLKVVSGPPRMKSASSLRTYVRKLHDRVRTLADACLGVLLVALVANLHFLPIAFCFLFFALTTNLRPLAVAFYGVMAAGVEFLMVVSRSIAIHLYLKNAHEGEPTKRRHRFHVTYALPQLLVACVPALATYYHYRYDMDALVPVLILTVWIYAYEITYRGHPEQTGSRERLNWITGPSYLVEAVKRYFRGQIIRAAPLDPTRHYIFSFHPHGIIPISVAWLQFNAQWRHLFPNVHAHVLTASILHQLPLARDVLHFYGSREVARPAFAATLAQQHSVLLVPGGQAEMLHQRSGRKQVRVYTQHKGFIRLALEHGVPLVPVLSFREGEIMDNIQAPGLQRWFVKHLAFPFPHYPYGRALLPIPRRVEIPIVVGEPLDVPHIERPTPDDVDKVHAQYFARLRELFDQFKEQVGCADYTLVLI
ncbi:hypothetical protein PsorP6_007041 [Peronosclerospora sorghi]|uniref:Uncharacterized protein n=1 Tax=Peronosclerospora sorghi TaxID=230839 RepID=A0ACC0WAQ2_9STRA|nr:hypothetical protein PsorP6_007041 [Peronosclerospora sorghi]